MATDSTLQALVFVLISFSLADVCNAWCNRYSSDCNTGQVCCNNQCVYGSDCIGQSCSTSGDCSVGESCCNKLCKDGSDCIGQSCSTSGDCSVGESCCDGTCQDGYDCDYGPSADDDPTAPIVGITFGLLVVACMFSMCIYYAVRRHRVRPGRVIVGGRITATTVTTTRQVPQVIPPYTGQMPPSYQQGYPYNHLPQYEQHQTAAPPPYNPDATRASDQPPPYSAATQGRSGGVYTPQTSYGAVPPPSKPVV